MTIESLQICIWLLFSMVKNLVTTAATYVLQWYFMGWYLSTISDIVNPGIPGKHILWVSFGLTMNNYAFMSPPIQGGVKGKSIYGNMKG